MMFIIGLLIYRTQVFSKLFLLDELRERIDNLGIKLRSAVFLEFVGGFAEGELFAVRPPAGHGFKSIDDGHEARA